MVQDIQIWKLYGRDTVYGNDVLYTLKEDENIEIVGNQIQLIDVKVNKKKLLEKQFMEWVIIMMKLKVVNIKM